nr:MAG TPA: hypothetical protein [Caudoviricetes sp.]
MFTKNCRRNSAKTIDKRNLFSYNRRCQVNKFSETKRFPQNKF